jgi:hypothetical protein
MFCNPFDVCGGAERGIAGGAHRIDHLAKLGEIGAHHGASLVTANVSTTNAAMKTRC